MAGYLSFFRLLFFEMPALTRALRGGGTPAGIWRGPSHNPEGPGGTPSPSYYWPPPPPSGYGGGTPPRPTKGFHRSTRSGAGTGGVVPPLAERGGGTPHPARHKGGRVPPTLIERGGGGYPLPSGPRPGLFLHVKNHRFAWSLRRGTGSSGIFPECSGPPGRALTGGGGTPHLARHKGGEGGPHFDRKKGVPPPSPLVRDRDFSCTVLIIVS